MSFRGKIGNGRREKREKMCRKKEKKDKGEIEDK
jgi:hypothetical protein